MSGFKSGGLTQVFKWSVALGAFVALCIPISVLAQLTSSVPLDVQELDGFKPPGGMTFFSQEFWVVDRWRRANSPLATSQVFVSADRGRIDNIDKASWLLAGLPASIGAAYGRRDALMDSVSSGKATGHVLCGVPSVVVGNVETTSGGDSVDADTIAQVRGALGWLTLITTKHSEFLDMPYLSALKRYCSQNARDAMLATPPAGWEWQSPRWMHSVATWLGQHEDIDFIKVDPSADELAAAKAAELMIQDPPSQIEMQAPESHVFCGKPGLVIDWSGSGSTFTPDFMREIVIAGSDATYAIFDESTMGGSGLTLDRQIESFCPGSI